MAQLLYRLGRFSFRHAWTVLGAWVLIAAAVLGTGFALGGQTQESYAIPGTESQVAIDRLAAVFPQTAGASARLVLQAPDGGSLDEEPYRSAIDELAVDVNELDGVAQALSPFSQYASDAVSADDTVAIVQLQFDKPVEQVTDEQLAAVDAAAESALDAGMRIEYGGMLYQDVEYGITPTEIVGVLIAGVVLLITFGSLLAAGMPLLTAITGIAVAMGGVLGVAALTPISSATPLLALMIGLAVGIDYALFILSRHRQQLATGVDPEESAARAVGTAGSAVVFAGITVIIALLGLLVVGIPFLSAMGVAAAFAVLLAVLVSVTMLPALLGLAGTRLVPKPGSRQHRRITGAVRSFGTWWVQLVLKAPIVAVIAVVGMLGVLAIPAFSLQLALPTGSTDPAGSTARNAYDLVSDEFGPGHNGPLIVAVDITQTTDIQADLEGIADQLRTLDNVDFVSGGLPNPGLDTAIIQVIPNTGPDAAETTALVETIRDLAPAIADEYDTEIFVTGATAVQIDISSRLGEALVPFGVIVVGLSILLLMMVFRSVLVPIKAALGFLLSVVASFGVVVAVFQWGWFSEFTGVEPGPILSFMPILLMAVLFGLAMDYEVFLVSGMREEYVHSGDARQAIVRGFGNAARVVTAAALIMFCVFFAFVPEGSGVIKVIALGLACGVFFDAFLVRMTLVPAVMALLGRAAWWMPAWLGRLLPNVDIEGDSLREHRAGADWASTQTQWAVSAEKLIVGRASRGRGSATPDQAVLQPVTLHAAAGDIVVLTGQVTDRRLVAATLAGRVLPSGGHAQVLGHPLPSEADRAARLVALAGDDPAARPAVTVGELLSERLNLTRPWYRPGIRRHVDDWLARVNHTLESSPRVTASTPLGSLAELDRAVVLLAAALAESTPIVAVDVPQAFDQDAAALLTAAATLAPAGTTVLLGAPTGTSIAIPLDADAITATAVAAPTLAGRTLHTVRLDSGGPVPALSAAQSGTDILGANPTTATTEALR